MRTAIGRSAGDAIKAVHARLREGHTDVVDADLTKYFDTIPHDQLMRSVARRIVDKHIPRLIKMWLRAPVGEPDAGKPHVRFDERGAETERWHNAPSNRASPRLYPCKLPLPKKHIVSVGTLCFAHPTG